MGGGKGQMIGSAAKDFRSDIVGGLQAAFPGTPAQPYSAEWQNLAARMGQNVMPSMLLTGLGQQYDYAAGKLDPALQKAMAELNSAYQVTAPGMYSTQYQQQIAPLLGQISNQYAQQGLSQNQKLQMQQDAMTQMYGQSLAAQQQLAPQLAQMKSGIWGDVSQRGQMLMPAMQMASTFAPMSYQPAKPGPFDKMGKSTGGGGGGK